MSAGPLVLQTCAAVEAARPGARVILMGLRGSHAHGTYIAPDEPMGTDDTDTFAVWKYPPEGYFGVRNYGGGKLDGFETGGDTLDISAYDVRKFLHLLKVGNPNVHAWLWTPSLFLTGEGSLLRENKERLLTPRLYEATAGYASAQLHKMFKASKSGYMGAKREALLARHGYDIKNAAHCVRLLLTGIVLATEHRLLVRFEDENLQTVLSIKRGERSAEAVEKLANDLFARFNDLCRRPAARIERPDENLYDELSVAVISRGSL